MIQLQFGADPLSNYGPVFLRQSKRVKALREANGWSQEELADRAGMHRTYISAVERAVRNPTLTVIEHIAKALKVPISELLS